MKIDDCVKVSVVLQY